MKKYAVRIHYTTYLYEEVEAESKTDAIEKAKNKIDEIDNVAYAEAIVDNIQYDVAEAAEIDEEGLEVNPEFF